MLRTASDSLNISSRKPSSQRIAAITLDFIKKIPSPNRSQIIQELQELGLSEIEASQALRYLEDGNEIFIAQDSGSLKVLLYSNVLSPEFEREQKQFQDRWLRARAEGE